MSKLKFQANNWLHSKQTNLNTNPSIYPPSLPTSNFIGHELFSPGSFLIPDWKGESLISKHALSIKKILDSLKADALSQFDDFHRHTHSMKNSIYREFLSYIKSIGLDLPEISSQSDFWLQLLDTSSEYNDILKQFKDLYCFRVSTTYLYKIRFFLLLAKETRLAIDQKDLLNPSSFISKIFKKGSKNELNCESLKTHIYSWYRPSVHLENQLKDLASEFHRISITELMKLCTYQDKNRFGDTTSNQNLNFEGHDFSHSLSHKSFGHFLNQLITQLPKWFENKTKGRPENEQFNINPFLNTSSSENTTKVINTKFAGDALGPICHSHWVATESVRDNTSEVGLEIISPDFIDHSFTYGHYTKICHELKFLSSLVEEASLRGLDPISFIVSIFDNKSQKSSMDNLGQLSMLAEDEGHSQKKIYDRIVLNLIKLPKSNQHYHLLNKISEQAASLHQKGHLFIFTNQNLFVPSQSDKVDALLDKITLVSYINLEELKGKGEIPNFLYVFKKRSKSRSHIRTSMIAPDKSKREECLRFSFSGSLSRFGKFEVINNALLDFFKHKEATSTPIYQKDLDHNLNFYFHHDAILDGKLVGLEGSSSTNITHPMFFKNLTQTCLPFENFFSIENLNAKQTEDRYNHLTSDLLGINIKQEEKFNLLLIVNYTDSDSVSIEISDIETYQHKLSENGTAYFEYFGLNPKRNDINLNMFREFFSQPLGKQIIQLSLRGNTKHSKSKLNALLIPRFFMNPAILSRELEDQLAYLKLSKEKILISHPEELKANFSGMEESLSNATKQYPWHTIGLMTYFLGELRESLKSMIKGDNSRHQKINFQNPLVIDGIVKLKLFPLYPRNNDIFLNTPIENPQDVFLNLTSTKICLIDGNHALQLYSDQLVVAELFSEEEVLLFTDFILSNAIGMPISETLGNLKLPTPDDLKNVLQNFKLLEEELVSQIKKIQQHIFKTFTFHINQ